jgi:two-component system, LytTR family, sensor kinase
MLSNLCSPSAGLGLLVWAGRWLSSAAREADPTEGATIAIKPPGIATDDDLINKAERIIREPTRGIKAMFDRDADGQAERRDGSRLPWIQDPTWVRWGGHVLFWLLYFIVRSMAAAARDMPNPDDFPFLANRILAVSGYFLLTGALLACIAGPRATHSSWIRNVGLALGALALGPVTQWLEQQTPYILSGMPPGELPFVTYFFQLGWVLMLWGLVQALLGYHFETIAQSRAIGRAQALAYDAQIKMLHYQINPHFLFNTLNAISALVLERRNEQAEEMLLKLAGFLRYSLDRQPTELSRLADEFEAQRKYLGIEQTRLGDKLKVHFDVEPGLEDARLPSLILQPILENAIKFAIAPRAEGGAINVSARRDEDLLRICIEDDGPGFTENKSPRRRRGVGLSNARERLELMFGDRGGLNAGNRNPHGYRVDLWLPMEVQHAG